MPILLKRVFLKYNINIRNQRICEKAARCLQQVKPMKSEATCWMSLETTLATGNMNILTGGARLAIRR